jgi:beta-glucosidase
MNSSLTSTADRIETLIQKMALAEKVSLLSGKDKWHTVPIERLDIPSVVMTDGPHGVRANQEGRKRSTATSFPTGVSMASSWNVDLIEQVGAALAQETRALDCDILLGPCVNIVRHPLAGRNFESYSEDPYLAGRIGVAWVRGLQSQGVGASLKHYACNNQETERRRGDSQVDERALREIYLAQFEMVVKEARPWTVMCSYNRINGVYASQQNRLLNEILRGEWGFDGIVVSDWGANHTTVESVQGGLDLEMPGPARWYGDLLMEAIATWQIEEAQIDQAVRRILRLVERSGRMSGENLPEGTLNTLEHQDLARKLAEESIVLLKNEGNLLPLKAESLRSLAVIGPMTKVGSIGGGGSSFVEPPYRVSPLDGLKDRLGENVVVYYEPGCGNSISGISDQSSIADAAELAQRCDVALVFVGLPEGYESEGHDRQDMELTGAQNELVQAVVKANPNTVVVLNAGSPVAMPWIEPGCVQPGCTQPSYTQSPPSVLLAYYPGQEGGNAVASILLGEVNPSGKLSVTWPVRLQDTPAFTNFPGGREVRYGEGIFVGYRYYDYKDVKPLFPFGHGLSYTQFTYSNLQAAEKAKIGKPLQVSLEVTNTGSRAGQEGVQLYVRDVESSLPRPPKELKGFAKVALEAGQKKTVSFILDERAFAFYDPLRKDWVIEPGSYEILVGSSSRDIRQALTITLIG